MKDQFGRNIRYARFSLTERCTLKCAYCRADEGLCPKEKEISAKDVGRIGRALCALGIDKFRLTGGEPMLRRDIVEIVKLLSESGAREIAMTTNAQQLPGRVKELKEAGLVRFNISLDSLRPDVYRDMTGGGDICAVRRAIDEVLETGMLPLKLNAVLVRGKNDAEIDDFIALTKERAIDVRFIELMPLGALKEGDNLRVSADEILAARPELKPLPPRYIGQPSSDYAIDGYRGRVGFISAISHSFCHDCNRVRVMSDGMLRLCLGQDAEVDLKPALEKNDDALLLETLQGAVYHKPAGHAFSDAFTSKRDMSKIGG